MDKTSDGNGNEKKEKHNIQESFLPKEKMHKSKDNKEAAQQQDFTQSTESKSGGQESTVNTEHGQPEPETAHKGNKDQEEQKCTDNKCESTTIFETKTDIPGEDKHPPEIIYNRLTQSQAETKLQGNGESSAHISLTEWDDKADLPTIHLSFILRTILPKTQTSLMSQRAQLDQESFKKAFTGQKTTMVGSTAEGYKVPSIIKRGELSLRSITALEQPGDIDMLMVWDIKKFGEYDPASEPKQALVLQTSETYPGYARVFINDPEKVMRGVDEDFAQSVNNKLYLSAKKQRLSVNRGLQEEVEDKRYDVDTTGPAVGLEDPMKLTLDFFKSFQSMLGRQELVTALPCKWPSIANKWITRMKSNDWLEQPLIDEIVQEGCHVVPVAHRFSKYPDVEWRISFATSEVKLARTVITEEQRHCYVCLKVLRKQLVSNIEKKKVNFLTSYQCKTIFLYSCEKIPPLAWKENTATCFLYMIDRLLECFQNKCLPSFFIPENNLIDHFSEEESTTVATVLQVTRCNPIEPLLIFSDTRVMPGHGTTSSFRKSIDCVLRDFNVFKVNRNIVQSMVGFFQAQCTLTNSLLLDNNVDMAVANLFNIFQFYELYFPEQDIVGFINMAVLKWKLIMQLIQIFEKAVLYADGYPSVKLFRGYLGCLYYVASLNFTPETQNHRAAIGKAEYLYNLVIDEEGIQTAASVDYAIMLSKEGKVNQAEEILKSLLSSSEVKKTIMVSKYTHITYSILEDTLRNELHDIVKASLVVILPTLSLAYYVLLNCLVQCKKGFDKELEEFKNHCKTESEDWPYFLLGLFYLALEKYEEAHEAFVEATSINPEQPFWKTKVHTSKVQHMITLKKETEAVQYLLETGMREYSHLPILEFLDFIVLKLEKPVHAVKMFEVLMDLSEENPAYLNLRGNMGCMLHASAYEHNQDSDGYTLALAQTDTLFSVFITTLDELKIASIIDYVLFLAGQKRWIDAEGILDGIIPAKLTSKSMNSYGPIEYDTLDTNLKNEVDIQGKFETESVALAYYFLAKCFFNNADKTEKEFNDVVSDFDNFCLSKNDSRAFALLGYTYMLNSWWPEAEDRFCKAVEISWDYTAAKRNMMDCRMKAEALGFPERELRNIYSPMCIVPDLAGDYTLDYDKITAL